MKALFKQIVFLILICFLTFTTNAQKILFVGNSLTYTNNLPKILEHIAKKSDIKITTKSLCKPNYALVDHLYEGNFQKLMAKGKYDYVVVQQGPSSQVEGKKMLIEDGAIIKKICEKYNAKLVYFMVWTSKKWFQTFDLVIKNHKKAAKENRALLFPVGEFWKKYCQQKNAESLYSVDGFHPSKAGSFFAALTMFHHLYPKKNLHLLKFQDYKKWIKDKDSFKLMLDVIAK